MASFTFDSDVDPHLFFADPYSAVQSMRVRIWTQLKILSKKLPYEFALVEKK